MNPLQVIRNEFLHLLGNDHVAVDASGTPIARAGSLDAVKQAAPDATAYFTGKDFVPVPTAPTKPAAPAAPVTTAPKPVPPAAPAAPAPAKPSEPTSTK